MQIRCVWEHNGPDTLLYVENLPGAFSRGFEKLEQIPGFLTRPACEGSYGEEWSLRKLLRRFLWHDRIHAKAMYRMAVKTFGENAIPNIFKFE